MAKVVVGVAAAVDVEAAVAVAVDAVATKICFNLKCSILMLEFIYI